MATANSSFRELRVLHLTTTIDRGGAENYLIDLIRAQVDAGFGAIDCVYLKGRPYWQQTLEAMGVRVLGLNSRFYGDPLAILRLRRVLKRHRPDIVHVHGAPVEAYLVAATRWLRPRWKLVLTRHEPRRRLFKYPAFKLLDRMISRMTDRIIAVSASVRRADVERRPELAGKSVVIHHGIHENFATGSVAGRAAVRAEFGIGDDEVLIGTIARHTSEKSIDTLLRAFAAASSRLTDRVGLRLMLVGRGPLTSELKALAVELGIDDRTIWLPFRDDVPAVMGAFDVFALASREEGFGIVLIEAMACAKPIVACRIDAIPEIVIDEETGLVVPPQDVDTMAVALERLVAEPGTRTRLGESGQRRAAEHFTIPTMQARTLAIYKELIEAATPFS